MDLNSHFGHMFSHGLRMVNNQEDEVVIRVIEIGNIELVSGAIVACDPIYMSGPYEPYTLQVSPGSYPVTLSVATYTKTGYQQVVGARVLFGDGLPTLWQPALCSIDSPIADELLGYVVDSGTGCFIDSTLLSHLIHEEPTEVNPFLGAAMPTPELWERLQHVQSDEELQEVAQALRGQGSSPPQAQESVMTTIVEELIKTERDGWTWGNFVLDPATNGNVVIFSSGPGDGVYPSYFGLDADGKPLCLVTDFQLLQGARVKS